MEALQKINRITFDDTKQLVSTDFCEVSNRQELASSNPRKGARRRPATSQAHLKLAMAKGRATWNRTLRESPGRPSACVWLQTVLSGPQS